MSDWLKNLINKAREVEKHGWGSVYVSITKQGRRRAIKQTFDEIDEDSDEDRNKD